MPGPLLRAVVDAACGAHGPRRAIVDPTGTISYADLAARIAVIGEGLDRSKVGPGDRVLVVANDPTTALISALAVLGTGATCAISAPGDREGELRFAPNVFVDAGPDGQWIVMRHGPPSNARPLPAGLVVFSSGTTGQRKAVLHAHESFGFAVRSLQLVRTETLGGEVHVARDDSELRDALLTTAASTPLGLAYLGGMPIWTVAGLTIALQALCSGDAIVLAPGFDAVAYLATIARDRVTNLSLSPFMAQLLLRARRASDADDASSLVHIGIGGGPVPAPVAAGLEDAFGVPLTVGYGTTESAGPLAISRVTDPAWMRHETAGRALPGVEYEVAADDALSVRTASMGAGYVDGGVVVRAVCDASGWWATGDHAEVRDGQLVLTGRADDVIVRGARAVDPVALEQLLEEDPAVERAAVLGLPSRVAGEQDVCALVVTVEPPDVRELRRRCRDRYGVAPQRVLRVAELPLTEDGAVRRHLLAPLARQTLEES